MKKIISAFMSAALLSGCYQDLGNYEYTLDSMNEIVSINFSPQISSYKIELQRALTEKDKVRRITADVEQTLAKNYDNLDFNWYISHTDENDKIVNDTIHTKGYLDVVLPVGEDKSYDVFLQVYDKSTTLSKYSSFKIVTRPLFKNSLFILHGNEGNRKIGNIEIIGKETFARTDITPMTPDNIYSDATGFAYTIFYNFETSQNNVLEYFAQNLTIFGDGTGTNVYNAFGMDLKFVSSQIFKPESEDFKFKKIVQTGDPDHQYKVVLTETGDVYIGNNLHALYRPGYSIELNNDNALHQSDYRITAATITHNRFVFWDAKNNRFLYCIKDDNEGMATNSKEGESVNPNLKSTRPVIDANIDYTGLLKSPEDLTAVLGYINYRNNYETQNAYFVFRDENDDTYYRYTLQQLTVGEDKDGMASSPNRKTRENKKDPAFSISCEKLLNIKPECNPTTFTYNSWFTNNYLFYADKNTVYRYNVLSGDNVPMYVAPQGYEINLIKFRTEDSHVYSGDLGRYLSIAMFNGNYSAIAEIKLNTAADLDKDFVPLFYDMDSDGKRWGLIKDLQFVQDYNYHNEFER